VVGVKAVKVWPDGRKTYFNDQAGLIGPARGVKRSQRPPPTFSEERRPRCMTTRQKSQTEETLLMCFRDFATETEDERVLLISRGKGDDEADLVLLRLAIFGMRFGKLSRMCDAPTLALKLEEVSWPKRLLTEPNRKVDYKQIKVKGVLGVNCGPEQALELVERAYMEGGCCGTSVAEAAEILKVTRASGQLIKDALKAYHAWCKRRGDGQKRMNQADRRLVKLKSLKATY